MHMAALMMISLRYEYAEALPLGLGRLWAACGPAGDPNPPQEPQPENSSLQIMHVPACPLSGYHMDAPYGHECACASGYHHHGDHAASLRPGACLSTSSLVKLIADQLAVLCTAIVYIFATVH